MKEWLEMYNLVMKSSPRVSGDEPLMATGYNYISQKVLGFIATEGAGSTEPGVPYLSDLPDNFSIFLFHLFFVLG